MNRIATVTFLCGMTFSGIAHGGELQYVPYHLTARPWAPLNIPREQYLKTIEGICRFTARHQDSSGAVIDPVLKREHQYATPYFAYAVGTLVRHGKALDLLPNGIRAMEHATENFGNGRDAIPDQHGEFFIPALTGALAIYEKHTSPEQWKRWRDRLKKPRAEVIKGNTNNWETYVMKGEWMRQSAGLADRTIAIEAIESAWLVRHRARIAAPPYFLYHDQTSDPDTLSVEAVGRGNLLALTHLGYNGTSAAEIRRVVEAATRMTLLLQDPTGQTPTNGRTDNHVWVDVGYQLAFEVMAERANATADKWSAGQFRHAAMLAFQNIERWRRDDGEWAGSFFVTKNHFNPELRVGYQDASQYSNYNGSLMFHLAEAFHMRQSQIVERPAPNEIGGYALELDAKFASVFANAGGMLMQANLRGQVGESSGNRWTPLGVVRFSRAGWDSRLGPSDGALTADGGLSFAPAFFESGKWVHMADLSARYAAAWKVSFVHPLLVRCTLQYSPVNGAAGPVFLNEFTITPDGVLSVVKKLSVGNELWGVTWPILVNDGRRLEPRVDSHAAVVSYADGKDKQAFIALNDAPSITIEQRTLRSTYGDLRPVRMTAQEAENRTFVYPHAQGDPEPEELHDTFRLTPGGFSSLIARVEGNIYVGRTSAGGVGKLVTLPEARGPAAEFEKECGFILQLRNRKVIAVEVDRDVRGTVQGRNVSLKAFTPLVL